MKWLVSLLAPLVLLGCGGNGLSGDEKRACGQLVQHMNEALDATGTALRQTDREGIATIYSTASGQIHGDVVTLPADSKVRKVGERVAAEMDAAGTASENAGEIDFPSLQRVTADKGILETCKP